LRRGAGSPSNTMWPGPWPTYVPSFIVIHPTVWLQYTNVTERTERQTERTGQRTDSIAVGQKLDATSKEYRDYDSILVTLQETVKRITDQILGSSYCSRPY